jgi:thymidylate kinase
MEAIKKPKHFILDCSDGSGKTTQLELLHSYLVKQNFKVQTLRSQDGRSQNWRNEMCYRRYYEKTYGHKFPFFLDRRFVIEQASVTTHKSLTNIEESTDVVLWDRGYLNILMNTQRQFLAEGCNSPELYDQLSILTQMTLNYKTIISAAASIFLTIPSEIAIERVQSRAQNKSFAISPHETDEALQQQSVIYTELLKQPEQSLWYIIDGNRTPIEVHRDIQEITLPLI